MSTLSSVERCRARDYGWICEATATYTAVVECDRVGRRETVICTEHVDMARRGWIRGCRCYGEDLDATYDHNWVLAMYAGGHDPAVEDDEDESCHDWAEWMVSRHTCELVAIRTLG